LAASAQASNAQEPASASVAECASTQEIAASARALASTAQELERLVGQFVLPSA
jgi:hypothetical protein